MKLSDLLKEFFYTYLQEQRGVSLHTVRSYRDTFKLLLLFLRSKHGPDHVPRVEDVSIKTIESFLKYLEDPARGRGNSAHTRNQRLAALQSFFGWVSSRYPVYERSASKVTRFPSKRTTSKVMPFLNREELQALLKQPRTHTSDGIRNLAILIFLYNTGARASEVAEARMSWFNFPNRTVKILGKRRKERITPLWPTTIRLLKLYAEHHRRQPRAGYDDYFFINQRGRAFNRFGIRSLVKGHLQTAAKVCPSLVSKTLSTHSLRHTTAVHLLESRVDPHVIKSWLGHASVKSTDPYIDMDLTHKRQILDKFSPPPYVNGLDQPQQPGIDTDPLDWLGDL
jgi:integrase/recombinase XerC